MTDFFCIILFTYGRYWIWYSAFQTTITELKILKNKVVRNLCNFKLLDGVKCMHLTGNMRTTLKQHVNYVMVNHVHNIKIGI